MTLRGSLLTVREVADWCRLSEKTIRRVIERGELAASKVGNRWRVSEEDMHAWIEAKRFVPEVRPVLVEVSAPAERGSLAALRAIEGRQ
jgi:excisionase family DNA binding protein